VDSNKTDLKETGLGGAKWINLAQNSVAVNSVMISALHKKRRTSSIAE
jgi:hypothetical protein